MPVHFVVVASDIPERKPWIDCVSDGNSPYLPSFDARTASNCKVLLDVAVDATPPADFPNRQCREEYPAIEAIAKLDEAGLGSRDHFHRALALVFEMGMAAQRELDRKAHEVSAHADTNSQKRNTARDDYYAGQHE